MLAIRPIIEATMRPVPLPPPRLFLLQALRAPVGVLVRRGPSKRQALVRWDQQTDTFERGHWFKGRIREHACDLSPDGALFAYVASKYNGHAPRDPVIGHQWTAVSRAPWLTALALWPSSAAGSGALFVDDRRLELWADGVFTRSDDPPQHVNRLSVLPREDGFYCFDSSDERLLDRRLARDGWERDTSLLAEWDFEQGAMVTRRPERWHRAHREFPFRVVYDRTWANPLNAGRERVEGVYDSEMELAESFRVLSSDDTPLPLPEGRVDWIDWDTRGRLVILVDGRVDVAAVRASSIGPFAMLADFSADEPRFEAAPRWAATWKGL